MNWFIHEENAKYEQWSNNYLINIHLLCKISRILQQKSSFCPFHIINIQV